MSSIALSTTINTHIGIKVAMLFLPKKENTHIGIEVAMLFLPKKKKHPHRD